jgi:hypothetical protein
MKPQTIIIFVGIIFSIQTHAQIFVDNQMTYTETLKLDSLNRFELESQQDVKFMFATGSFQIKSDSNYIFTIDTVRTNSIINELNRNKSTPKYILYNTSVWDSILWKRKGDKFIKTLYQKESKRRTQTTLTLKK